MSEKVKDFIDFYDDDQEDIKIMYLGLKLR